MQNVTFISIPRYFHGIHNALQKCAIESWKALRPEPQILLVGDEFNLSESALELGVQHIKCARRNQWHAPLLNEYLKTALSQIKTEFVAVVSSDVLLDWRLVEAFETVSKKFPNFLLTAAPQASSSKPRLFLFPTNLLAYIPPLAVGRDLTACWLLSEFFLRSIPIIDGSTFIQMRHQEHDLVYSKWGTRERLRASIEAQAQERLCRELVNLSWQDLASVHLTPQGEVAYYPSLAERYDMQMRIRTGRPNSEQTWATLIRDEAMSIDRAGDPQRALEQLDQIKLLNARPPGLSLVESVFYIRLQNYDKAIERASVHLHEAMFSDQAKALIGMAEDCKRTQIL